VYDKDLNVVLGFGSGSFRNQRDNIVIFNVTDYSISTYNSTILYKILRSNHQFSGGDLNIEGSIIYKINGQKILRLYQRGNFVPHEGKMPIDSSLDLKFVDFMNCLTNNWKCNLPELSNLIHYAFGNISGVKLSITEAQNINENLNIALLVAENSTDTNSDGVVIGCGISFISSTDDSSNWIPIYDHHYTLWKEKPEGIYYDIERKEIFVVTDPDSNDPAKICLISYEQNLI